MIKQASISFGESKNNTKMFLHYKKKETFTQTLVSVTPTEILHVKLEFQKYTNKGVDAITTSCKCIISNLMKMSEGCGTDSDDD